MILPEACYNFSEKDLRGIFAEFVTEDASSSVASASIQATIYTVPNDRLLIVQSLMAYATPGAAQNAVRILLGMVDRNGRNIVLSMPEKNVGATVELIATVLPVELVIPQGSLLYCQGDFNAGAAANSVAAYMTGWLVPRGGVAF